jgi:hypothetical protein
MKHWTIGGLVGACVGVSIYLVATQKPATAPVAHQETAATPAQPQAPPAPVVLAQVVDVTDIDPLLDPPAKPVAGVPFDSDSTAPVSASPAPERIPPARD